MAILRKVLGKIPAFNMYKWGAIVLVVISYTTLVGGYGYHKASVKCEKAKTEQVEKRAAEVVRTVTERIPVVQKVEVESAKQRQEIKKLKEDLDEAIARRPESASCDLSDAEFDGVRALSAKTHIK